MAEDQNTTARIPLSKGYFAVVDSCDSESISKHKWSASEHRSRTTGEVVRVYAVRMERGKMIMMHGEIFGVASGDIDHRNADTLNNTRGNLRSASRTQNNANQRKRFGPSSKYKGVFYHAQTGKWCAQMASNGIKKHLGLFREEFDAATAYNFAAHEAFGEFARLNEVPL